jgi:hypothetical protein
MGPWGVNHQSVGPLGCIHEVETAGEQQSVAHRTGRENPLSHRPNAVQAEVKRRARERTGEATEPRRVRKNAGPRKPMVCMPLRTQLTGTPLATIESASHPPTLAITAMVIHGSTEYSPESWRLKPSTCRGEERVRVGSETRRGRVEEVGEREREREVRKGVWVPTTLRQTRYSVEGDGYSLLTHRSSRTWL